MSDTYCEKHKIEKRVLGGCSAHHSNWYCPECFKESELRELKKVSNIENKSK